MKLVKLLTLGLVLLNLGLLTACNTVEGFGKDMQKGGKEVQHTANENK